MDSERLRQSCRRLPEEKPRGELFGIRTTLLNTGACPEDEEEEEQPLGFGRLYGNYRRLPEKGLRGELFGL